MNRNYTIRQEQGAYVLTLTADGNVVSSRNFSDYSDAAMAGDKFRNGVL